MRNYEIMFIVNSTLDEKTIKETIELIKTTITGKGGTITNEKDMGQRELAYEINNHKNGYYFLINALCNEIVINEIERISNVNENIIRHLIIKVEE